jgi:hypothetical protein
VFIAYIKDCWSHKPQGVQCSASHTAGFAGSARQPLQLLSIEAQGLACCTLSMHVKALRPISTVAHLD